MKKHAEYTDMVLKLVQQQAAPKPQAMAPLPEPAKPEPLPQKESYIPDIPATFESKESSFFFEPPGALSRPVQSLFTDLPRPVRPEPSPFAQKLLRPAYYPPQPAPAAHPEFEEFGFPPTRETQSMYVPQSAPFRPPPGYFPRRPFGGEPIPQEPQYPTPGPFGPSYGSSYMRPSVPVQPQPPQLVQTYQQPPPQGEAALNVLFHSSVDDWKSMYVSGKFPCERLATYVLAALDHMIAYPGYKSDAIIHVLYHTLSELSYE